MTVIATSLLAARNLQATNEYWDSNGATAGAGVTPTGTWGTDAFWTTSTGGTTATSLYTTTSADSIRFSAGADTVGPYTVTLNGSQNALQVLAYTGELTLSGGTLVLAQTGSGTGLGTNGTANMTVGSTLAVTNSAAGSFLIFAPVASTSITINGTVTASSPTNSTYIQLKTGTGTVNINTNLGNDANFKAALQLGGLQGGVGTLNLNGNQTLGTAKISVSDATRIGTINLGSTVNTGNAVQVGQIDMYNVLGNMTGAVINVNSAVATTGLTLRAGAALNVAGSLTNSGGMTLGLSTDATHGATMKILNGGTASLTTINVVDGSVLTNAGTLSGTTLYLGEATGNTNGKFVMGDATGVGATTLTQITTLGTGTSNAIVGGNSAVSTLTLNLSANATFSGNLGGAGANENHLAFVKQSAPTLTLAGNNTYTGATTVNAGGLKAGVASVANVSGAFGNNSAVSLANAASAVLDITGFHTQIGSLTGGGAAGGNVTLGAATLTVGGDNTSPATYAGVISSTGAGGVTKIGTGTQTFSGANTYTGTTTISAGTLLIAGGGSLAASSAVSVNAGTLGGAGTINGAVAVASGATLQAGLSLGDAATFTLNNNLTMAAGSILSIGLGAGAATHDILARTGSGTWTFDANQSFRFLDQGAVAGTTYTGIITGLSSPASVAGWTVANSGWAGSFSINGNNIDFALSAIPEPSTWGLIAGAGAFLLLAPRRRRARM